jgi:Peptidase family C25
VPEYLCLAGFPDTIPQEISNGTIAGKDVVSDLPYSNADADPFAEICVARLVAEDVSTASLYVSRVLTYNSLLAPDWAGFACQALWENTLGEWFQNTGFRSEFRHTREDLKWKVAPAADGTGGEREATISQDSPLAHCSLIAHSDHSWWREIGAIFRLDAKVLLAPTVVESGGCVTGALDGEEDFKTVIPRLFRNGAVSYVGNARNGAATSQIQRMEFWTHVLDGKTVGQAHRSSINSALGTVLNKDQDPGTGYLYQLRIRTLFGDPAFRPHIPGKKKLVGAHITLAKDIVTVHAPATWCKMKIVVPSDWTDWVGKDLYALRGIGSYSKSEWGSRKRNQEQTCYTAEFTTQRPVAEIKQLGNPPAPLGMLGKWQVDLNSNGSSTYRWVVRLADFDEETGRIIEKRDSFDYQISFK